MKRNVATTPAIKARRIQRRALIKIDARTGGDHVTLAHILFQGVTQNA